MSRLPRFARGEHSGALQSLHDAPDVMVVAAARDLEPVYGGAGRPELRYRLRAG